MLRPEDIWSREIYQFKNPPPTYVPELSESRKMEILESFSQTEKEGQISLLKAFGGVRKDLKAQDKLKSAFLGGNESDNLQYQNQIRVVFGKEPKTEGALTENQKELKEVFDKKNDFIDPSFFEKDPLENQERKENLTLREAFGGRDPQLTESQIAAQDTILESVTIDSILESSGEPFTFRGKALKVDRRNKNNRRYKKGIVERALQEIGLRTLTVMSGHPNQDSTDPSNVIGRVTLGNIGADGWLSYKATISNTSKGLDIQKLLKDKCIGDVSLRSKGRTAVVTENGKTFENVVSLSFRGLDMVIEGSEEGSGVEQIL